MRRSACLALVLAQLAGCGEGDTNPAARTPNRPVAKAVADPVVAAAEKSILAGPVSVRTHGYDIANGRHAAFSTRGEYQTRPPRFRVTVNASSHVMHGVYHLERVDTYGQSFFRSAVFPTPAGRPWLRSGGEDGTSQLGDLLDLVSREAPPHYLDELAASDARARMLGHDAVAGTPATRYATAIDMGKLHVRATVWVDGRGLIRRIRARFPALGLFAANVVTADFTGYGTKFCVCPPQRSLSIAARRVLHVHG